MTKFMKLDVHISEQTTELFFKELNDLKKDDELVIYIHSGGGSIFDTLAIVDAINHKIEEGLKVRLVVSGVMYSAAFFFFFAINTLDKKIIETIGMVHSVTTFIDYRETIKKEENYLEQRKHLKIMNNHFYEYYKKLGLNAKDLKMLKSGKDNFMDLKRVNQLLERNLILIQKGENNYY